MKRLEVSGEVRPTYGSLGVKRLSARCKYKMISAQQAKLNNYKNTKLKLLKNNCGSMV